MTEDGKIGIRTKTPTHTLTVNGPIRTTQDVIVDTNPANGVGLGAIVRS